MKKSLSLILIGMLFLASSSLIFSQTITTSGKTARNSFTTANRATLLYEQLPSGTNLAAYTSQEFGDIPTYSNEGADDFIVPAGETWNIEKITAFGGGWAGFVTTNLVNIKFYHDNAGQPAAAPFQSYLSYSCTTEGVFPVANLVASLPIPLPLPAGHYWLSVAFVGDFITKGQWGFNVAASVSNNQAMWINPGNGFGLGSNWQPGSILGANVPIDWAFRLEGTSGGGEPSAVPVSNWALFIGIGLILMAAIIRFRRLI